MRPWSVSSVRLQHKQGWEWRSERRDREEERGGCRRSNKLPIEETGTMEGFDAQTKLEKGSLRKSEILFLFCLRGWGRGGQGQQRLISFCI